MENIKKRVSIGVLVISGIILYYIIVIALIDKFY